MRRIAFLFATLCLATCALAQNTWQSNPNEESKKYPTGSSQERKSRVAARAAARAYTKHFDLSQLPHYVPETQAKGTVRVCGNNYVNDAPLGGYWKEAFEKLQPGVTIDYFTPTAAIAVPCLYFDKADIGVNHEPSFYDDLAHLRMKGFEPVGFSVFTGSYDYVGWQNNLVVVVNKDNPIAQLTMKQLDGIFGSVREGGWVGATWHPEFRRGADANIRTWGQLGLTGDWADRHITPHGYSLRYATAIEFSNKVLQASDKWNEDLRAYANYKRPNGTVYLEADQILDQVRSDPFAIGYVRFHQGFPKDVKIVALARDDGSPAVPYTMATLQDRSYPLWGDQSFWVAVKAGTKMDPPIKEFIRFVLSREGQELVQKDGKYLPLDAKAAREELAKLSHY